MRPRARTSWRKQMPKGSCCATWSEQAGTLAGMRGLGHHHRACPSLFPNSRIACPAALAPTGCKEPQAPPRIQKRVRQPPLQASLRPRLRASEAEQGERQRPKTGWQVSGEEGNGCPLCPLDTLCRVKKGLLYSKLRSGQPVPVTHSPASVEKGCARTAPAPTGC